MANRSSDFIYPVSQTSYGSNVACSITLKTAKSTNKNSIYCKLMNNSFSTYYNKVGPGSYNINISYSWFRRNNAYAVIQVDTYDQYNNFISGSFAHSILLYHSSYKNYLYNCSIPDRTYPGETCTINVTAPKDALSGAYYDVVLVYHSSVGRHTIATKQTKTGNFNFVVPAKATNSSMTVYIETKNSSGSLLGSLPQSIKIEKPTTTVSSTSTSTQINKPQMIFPDNYTLTLSEGENVKIKGSSENINDYMIIYAKQPCDIAKAVADYNTANGYYEASPADLKAKLLANVKDSANYYILKSFDADSTFMDKDKDDPRAFWIRTPGTNDYDSFDDFYALQWFKGIEPGDIIYLYAIERGTIYTTTVTTTTTTIPGESGDASITAGNWRCRHCDLNGYATWSTSAPWSPYCPVNLSTARTFLGQYSSEITSATFTVKMYTSCTPPTIFVTTAGGMNGGMYNTTGTYLTPITSGVRYEHTYTVPVSLIASAIASGYSNLYFRTHWGNTGLRSNTFYPGPVLKLTARKNPTYSSSSSTKVTTSVGYSDTRHNCISSIPTSQMTPYVVIPPAVRPLELTITEQSKSQATISYTNPLAGAKTENIVTYKFLSGVSFDISKGTDEYDLSDLNPIINGEGNEVQVDNTLYLDTNEKRLKTYEQSIIIPDNLMTLIRRLSSDTLYVDLELKSIDSKSINFEDITTNRSKVQIMFSKDGQNKTRAIDYTVSQIDLKRPSYHIKKVKLDKSLILNNEFNTIHLLYNVNEYEGGKAFPVEGISTQLGNGQFLDKVGWRKINNKIGTCNFSIETWEIAKYALFQEYETIVLCLENMMADSNLFAAPKLTINHKAIEKNELEHDIVVDKVTEIEAFNQGEIKPGEDIYYILPNEIFDANFDDTLIFSIAPQDPYPINTPDITFTNACVEVVQMAGIETGIITRYTSGFTADIVFFEEKNETVTNTTNVSVSAFDPVQCVDIIMCCFDKNRQLLNKSINKRRDIYNGKEFVYYTDRKWHSFVNDKYANNIKYKSHYSMTFSLPEGTEYMYFIAFTYSNWHDNPSIYSMSNILTTGSVTQDFSLEFVNPVPLIDEITGDTYANSDINNPVIDIKVNAQKNSSITVTDNMVDNGFNLAKDKFNRAKWIANPIIYSNVKTYGYEQPIFDPKNLYSINNVTGGLEPLYNDIEYYNSWAGLYGKQSVFSPDHVEQTEPVNIESRYTIYEDEGDKYISNNAVPYIEIPSLISRFDRSKLTLFLDTDFGVGTYVKPTKLVTESYTESYPITKLRNGVYGVANVWSNKIMNAFMDIASIVDIKIEWGMKLNRGHTHPTQGRKGPILVEDLVYNASTKYDYDPGSLYPAECSGEKIRDRGGNNIWHKNYGDYIYFTITNPRIKRLFLETNSHRRRHDAIRFEDYAYDWCWETTVKVKFTITRKVYEDGTPIYKAQNLPPEHFTTQTWVNGWATYSLPTMKFENMRFTKEPTASSPSFTMQYDVMMSPVVYYYKTDFNKGDSYGNKFKYCWGDNPEAFMKWETITVSGTAPYNYNQTHYYIAYNKANVVAQTVSFSVGKDGTITLK